jgi:hypothetical protein
MTAEIITFLEVTAPSELRPARQPPRPIVLEPLPARATIHHGPQRPSRLVLPVEPA